MDVPSPFVEKTKLSPFNSLGTFVENEVIPSMDLLMDSVLFHYLRMSVLLPMSHCLDYCNFMVNLEIELCVSSNFSF